MDNFEKLIAKTGEIGYVTQVINTIVYAEGLPGASPDELVVFETGETGQVVSLSNDFVEIMIFTEHAIKVGTKITRTNSSPTISVTQDLLGEIIDPFGNLLTESKKIRNFTKTLPIDTEPKGITERKNIKKYLETGTSIVDLMIPLGKGQRELVIGDRQTGKTNFLLNTVLTQAREGNVCIYACIGKKKIEIKKTEEFFIKNKIMDKVVIVASTSTDPAGVVFTTPYSAMTIAEYFKDLGKDVLIVLDDLSTHAKFYREISLLGKRFPGRNSYPGDIFYVHARLLERAGNFITVSGENAITCLPVIETTQGDLSGYIQTNLMSMTDGHLFFDSNLFYQGRRPAVNPFLSVTRVGRQTQSEIKRSIGRELTSFLTLYEKMQNFVHFGSELNESAKLTLNTGEKILHLFNQPLDQQTPISVQIAIFTLLWANLFPEKTIKEIIDKRTKLTLLYLQNNEFKNNLDNFLEESKTLNELLGKIRDNNPVIAQITNL